MFAKLPSMKYLIAFEAVARHCSIAKAASEISLTSSALSKQIQALESHLGVTLFIRSTRRIELTEQGMRFSEVVGASFRQLQAAINDIAPQTGDNSLRLSASSGFIPYALAPKLPEFKAAYPDISLSIFSSNGNEVPDFQIEPLDAAIVLLFNPMTRHELSCDPIFKGCYVQPMCAPSLLPGGRPFARPEQLAELTWLKNRASPDVWDSWLKHAGVPGLQPREVCWFGDVASLFEACAAGLGVAMLGGAAHAPAFPRLVPAQEFRVYSDVANYFLVYPPYKSRKPALRAFRSWLLNINNPVTCAGESLGDSGF